MQSTALWIAGEMLQSSDKKSRMNHRACRGPNYYSYLDSLSLLLLLFPHLNLGSCISKHASREKKKKKGDQVLTGAQVHSSIWGY